VETPAVQRDGAFPARPSAAPAGQQRLPGQDEQVGEIFRNMRLAMKVSRETIARRLATSTWTVDNFEAGAIAALPHWKETARIVRGYCELLRLDPEPLLRRIQSQLQAIAGQASAAPVQPPQPQPAATALPAMFRAQPAAAARPSPTLSASRRRRLGGQAALYAIGVPILLLAAVAGLAHVAPRPVYRAVMLLPDPVETSLRAGLDYLALLTAPRREGLRWIDVGDPRLRKADKLPTSPR
jgi:hypothetical protein